MLKPYIAHIFFISWAIGSYIAFRWMRKSVKRKLEEKQLGAHDPGVFYHIIISPIVALLFVFFVVSVIFGQRI